jgi:SAM-dependent methyltransferase
MSFSNEEKYLPQYGRWLIEQGRYLLQNPDQANDLGLDAAQKSILQQQLQFRKRSSSRFPNPENWLWTDRSLSQASDWLTANFKSHFFPEGAFVLDGCCGAGVDAIALAARGPVIAIDCDPWMVTLAADNAKANERSVKVRHELLTGNSLQGIEWLHVDPDRRIGELRTQDADHFSPTLPQIFQLFRDLRGAVIKIGPSSRLSDEVMDFVDSNLRRVWIGSRGECRQQILLYGQCGLPMGLLGSPYEVSLSLNRSDQSQPMQSPNDFDFPDKPIESALRPNGPTAVLLEDNSNRFDRYAALSFVGSQDSIKMRPSITHDLADYVFDLHHVLFASGLHADWAVKNQLRALGNPLGYYTGNQPIFSPWVQTFQVIEELAWDDRKVRKWLRHYQAGSVEVKCRLLKLDANAAQRRYQSAQVGSVTLLVTRLKERVRCIACKRIGQ